jgi:hypothetical protein
VTSENDITALKQSFQEAWITLRGTEFQPKAKEIYDLRKNVGQTAKYDRKIATVPVVGGQ